MKTVQAHTTETLEVKQSKFIAHLFPYERFDEILAQLKEEHPKARHFVTGFRYLNAFEQVVEGCSDDGEPKGTSGKPTLAVLQGQELINVGVITVRYFGGTKLGTGGLVRAYSDATNLVIEQSGVAEYVKELDEKIAVAYSNISQAEYALSQHGVRVKEKAFDAADAVFTVTGTREALDAFYGDVKRLVEKVPDDR